MCITLHNITLHYITLHVLDELPLLIIQSMRSEAIAHFTVVCLVIWPLSGSEAGGDLVLIQTLLLFICKYKLVSIRIT